VRLLAFAFPLVVAASLAVFVAILPRLDRAAIGPQSGVVLAGDAFSFGEFADRLVLGVVPAVTFADLVQVDVAVANIQVAAGATFGIGFDRREADFFVIDPARERLARFLPVRLPVLRCVNSVEADLVAAAVPILDEARVSVDDFDDPPANEPSFPAIVATLVPALLAPVITSVITVLGRQVRCEAQNRAECDESAGDHFQTPFWVLLGPEFYPTCELWTMRV